MIEDIRALLDGLTETPTLDLLETWGADRKAFKKLVSTVRKHITTHIKAYTPIEVMHSELTGLDIPRRLSQLIDVGIGRNPKIDSVKHIIKTLELCALDEYPHKPAIHKDYAGVLPTADNIVNWKDQWGYNVFETPRRKIADVALLAYQKKYGKRLMKPEVRKSDPVEHAPQAHQGRAKK